MTEGRCVSLRWNSASSDRPGRMLLGEFDGFAAPLATEGGDFAKLRVKSRLDELQCEFRQTVRTSTKPVGLHGLRQQRVAAKRRLVALVVSAHRVALTRPSQPEVRQ